ncbi:MAG: hypothetical protein CMI00_11450 [Oceanospirillaceae bacterium]|nr:hypothetical protein [Oceanospirillaceae bacterium]|tara:strand:- start:527 stop:4846 length:4320 start_codon:yes stop_codon:yes gene_type:complete
MRSLFAKKKVFPELYLKTFNRDFYRQVYFHEHQGKKIQEHFLENLESRKFDPSPLFNLDWICSKTDLTPHEVMVHLAEDPKFADQYQSVSLAVLRHFDIEPREKLVKDIAKSRRLIDSGYYLDRYPDVGGSWMTPYLHYGIFGWKEGRWPNSEFDSAFYLTRYEDVKDLNINPFVHYCEFGQAEGRFPNADVEKVWIEKKEYEKRLQVARVFDPVFYLKENPDVREAGIDPIEHFNAAGDSELRRPNAYFYPEYYLQKNEDVRNGPLPPFAHFREFGWKEKRPHFADDAYIQAYAEKRAEEARQKEEEEIRHREEAERLARERQNTPAQVLFDAEYYLRENPDVAQAGVDPEHHYYSSGEAEGRCPNPYFSPMFYRRLSADVRAAGIPLFSHYAGFGFWEGRLGAACDLRTSSYVKKPLLFVGHDGIQAGSEVVLLEVIKWFYHHTDRRIKTLLLSPGPLANQYAEYSDCYVLPDYSVDCNEDLAAFLKADFEFCYINTVVAGQLFRMLSDCDITLKGDVIAHVHEMEKVIRENEESFALLKERACHYISASPASSRDMVEHFGIAPEDITTVPAFIRIIDPEGSRLNELRSEARTELGIPEDAFVVAGCGTVYWRKGPDIFLDCAKAICAEQGDVHFVWIGPGPDLDATIDSIPEELKERIHFVGGKDHASQLLACADLFFLSSREDPFPLVVMEAAQHAVPSLCFDEATGITDFILDDAGYTVPSINTDDAITALRVITSDREDVVTRGRVARERVLDKYTSEKQCLNIFNSILEHSGYTPSVSVIVPFYNHEKFVGERLDTVLGQSIKDIEVILMDDLSTDNTVAVASEYLSDPRVRMEANTVNSGSPFKQWKKGLGLAQSELVWIAEGDDACDLNFLSTLLPYFDDQMMAIASAKTEIIDEHSTLKAGVLMTYLDSAYQDKYRSSFRLDGFDTINQDLGAVCTLVNASGLILRKQCLKPEVLDEAGEFKMCGDWYLYISMLRHGKLAYDVTTTNYFRRHSASQVNKVEGTDVYFIERYRITRYVVENFCVDRRMINKAFKAIDGEWARFLHKPKEGGLEDYYDKQYLTKKAKYSKKNNLHVAFYVHGMLFSKGGIERLAADIANYLAERGYKVTIFCRQWGKASASVYPVYDNVDVVGVFDENQQAQGILNLRTELLQREVDLFIPMLSEWLFAPIVAATEYTGVPVVVSEHNDPWKIEELWWSHEDRVECFNKAEKIHLLLNGFTESLPEDLKERAVIIPNGINMPDVVSDYSGRENLIVAIGRLAPQKRFDRLITAIARIQKQLREQGWQTEIWGEGQLRQELEEQIADLGVVDLVTLKGVTSDISTVLNRAAINVMPSEFEGFGIALAEAMSYGIPSIAYADCNGPNELIRNGQNGLLVNDTTELATEILTLIEDEAKRIKMSKDALSKAKKYDKNKVFRQWETLVNSFVKG